MHLLPRNYRLIHKHSMLIGAYVDMHKYTQCIHTHTQTAFLLVENLMRTQVAECSFQAAAMQMLPAYSMLYCMYCMYLYVHTYMRACLCRCVRVRLRASCDGQLPTLPQLWQVPRWLTQIGKGTCTPTLTHTRINTHTLTYTNRDAHLRGPVVQRCTRSPSRAGETAKM